MPWVANQFTSESQDEAAEEMEAEETEEATMEIEDSRASATVHQLPDQHRGMMGSDTSVLPQWQHCMTPQFSPTTTSSPIVWFR